MRIISWNSQGNAFSDGRLPNIINRYIPDVICIQESGKISNISMDYCNVSLKEGFYIPGTERIHRYYKVFYYPWRNESRCSMVTLINDLYDVREHSIIIDFSNGISATDVDNKLTETASKDDKERKELRGMLQTVIWIGHGYRLSVNNVHLPSGCPKFAQKIAGAYLKKCSNSSRLDIMIGDMNIPSTMAKGVATSYRRLIPQESTHQGGNTLDYAFANINSYKIWVEESYRNSDHRAVILDFDL